MPVPNAPYSTCKIVLNINSFLARRIVSLFLFLFPFFFPILVTRSLSLVSIDLLFLQKLRIPVFTCIDVIALEVRRLRIYSWSISAKALFFLFFIDARRKRSFQPLVNSRPSSWYSFDRLQVPHDLLSLWNLTLMH